MGKEMNARSLREHAIETVFVFLQAMVILAGSGLVALSIKIYGESYGSRPLPFFSMFVRDWGFLFLVVPAVWALGCVWLERDERFAIGQRSVVVTGILVLIGLAFLMMGAMVPPPLIHATPIGG